MRRQRFKVDSADWLNTYSYPQLADMQREYGLAPTGILDIHTAEAMTARRCGCAFRRGAGAGAPAKLPTNRPLVYFQDYILTDFTQDTFVTAVLQGMNLWNPVCNILFARTSKQSEANIIVKTEAIDGPGETLAYAYFPSGTRLGLPLVFGSEEAWDKPWGISLRTTACHEGGHNMGIDHDPSGKGLMAAFYNPDVLIPTSQWEVQQALSRYGQPALPPVTTTPPVVPTPLPPGGEKIRITVSGSNLKVEGYEKV